MLIAYSVAIAMPLSKVKRKQQVEDYDINYHLKRNFHSDKDTRILKNHCDLCNEQLLKEADNIQYRINKLDEIDNSFESEYDKHEPRLLLCSFLHKEYNIPSYCA